MGLWLVEPTAHRGGRLPWLYPTSDKTIRGQALTSPYKGEANRACAFRRSILHYLLTKDTYTIVKHCHAFVQECSKRNAVNSPLNQPVRKNIVKPLYL